jgi:hypothetical protein
MMDGAFVACGASEGKPRDVRPRLFSSLFETDSRRTSWPGLEPAVGFEPTTDGLQNRALLLA